MTNTPSQSHNAVWKNVLLLYM